MKTRTAIIGCVEFSKYLFNTALHMPNIDIVAVITRSFSPNNSDFYDLSTDALKANIHCYTVKEPSNSEIMEIIKKQDVQLGICVGWSNLLPENILQALPLGCIGYHPSALPANRGRHPLIWALALGLEETASTFFLMDGGADTGPILDQEKISIDTSETAISLYKKIINSATKQLPKFLPLYITGKLELKPQDNQNSNSWRKRSINDGHIDWRMTFDAIDSLVRALNKPYPGATCSYLGNDIHIWKVDRGPDMPVNIEPGKVLDITDGTLLVKCWDGSVKLVEHDFNVLPKAGEYVL